MAFLLDRKRSLARSLKRLSSKQLSAARQAIDDRTPPSDAAIHEARKHVKKARAIVRLLESAGTPGLGNARKRLRRISHALSPIRDAAAMRDSLQRLRESDEGLVNEQAYRALDRRLSQHAQVLRRTAQRDGTWKHARRRLRTLARATSQWRTGQRGRALLTAGLAEAHRRARKALERTDGHGRPGDFHLLRKAVKTLWYQLRLLDRGGSPLHTQVAALDDAEVALGDDHNITVLLDRIGHDAEAIGIDRTRLAAVALRFQKTLRRRAIARIRPIAALRTRNFVRTATAAWKEDN